MTRRIASFILFFIIGLNSGISPGYSADPVNLLYLDVHRLPITCADPIACIPDASPLMSNIMVMSNAEVSMLSQALNARSVVRGLTPVARAGLCHRHTQATQHDAPVTEKPALLTGHPGVYFDSSKVDGTQGIESFSGIVRDALRSVGLRELTKEEWQATPGRPQLTLRYSARRESAGCIIPFSFAFSIKEEAVLVRNNALKSHATVYSAIARQDLANTNYTLMDALQTVLQKFVADYKTANPGE